MSENKKVGWDVLSRLAGDVPPAAPGHAQFLGEADTLFNRELSWLEFNERVLSEAADTSIPALERLRFCTIVSSNLDEFFMVRVAALSRVARRAPARKTPDGMTAAQVYAQVREHVVRQKARQAVVLPDILNELRYAGIRIDTDFPRTTALDRTIRQNLPGLSVTIRRSNQPLPHLAGGQMYVFVSFPGEYAIITLQDRQSRLLRIPSKGAGLHFVLLERWLADRAPKLFADREVLEAFPFKVIREADLRYRPDDEGPLEEQILEAVGQRTRARVVRLEVDAAAYSEGALFLATALGLDSASLYRFDLPLDLRTLMAVYQAKNRPRLKYPPVEQRTPHPFRRRDRIFEVIKKKDFLVHHPYDSFKTVLNFISRAAEDPRVTRIYHTLYRTSLDSPVMEALKLAAKNGKQVTAYVEIKARFDELNNLRWAQDLRRAGVRVIRPFGNWKVHSKATQVFRREGAEEASYLHLGTGNYHPTTARQYTDLGLLTRDQDLGREVARFFGALVKHRRPKDFDELLVAPVNMHRQTLALIHQETALQRHGVRGHIIAKMNSLVDKETISALYEASRAGVRIELIVRGICCLRPQIRGLSENIRVISIIDRFLEHSRAYYFRAGGEGRVYLSSADWMPRNFFTRMELAFPVKDPALKRYIREVVLHNALNDNVKAWHLRPDGTYTKPRPPAEQRRLRSQFVLESLAKNHYKDTILAARGA
ncbi:MAG: polyphosphate kinase 1 [Elusimicrobia bacterium]|nr:polyphosphate kinase 1 [Elusimicrobiota bacterium]